MRKYRHRQLRLSASPESTVDPEAWGRSGKDPGRTGRQMGDPGRILPLTRGGTSRALFSSSGKRPGALVPKPGLIAEPQRKQY